MPLIQPECLVYTREYWSAAWTLQDRVYCDRFTLVAGPDIGEATLRYNYGIVEPAEDLQSAVRTAKSLNGYWVRIVLDQNDEEGRQVIWYGRIVQVSHTRNGLVSANGSQVESGEQIFHCRGLEYELHRTIVDSSFVYDVDEEAETEIGRAIGFNLGQGRENDHFRHGNRSDTKGTNGAYLFGFDIGPPKVDNTAGMWSAQDIIEYLLAYHHPANADGKDKLDWTPPTGGDAAILDALYPLVQAQGRSVKEILDEIIDRRRLLGYRILVQGDNDSPKVDVFTFNSSAFTLPGGTNIPANSNSQTFYFDDDATIVDCQFVQDEATRYDRVIARGAPLTGTCTIGDSKNSSLIKDWDSTLQTSYNTGASADGGYAALVSFNKQAANQAFRAQDQLIKVYRAFLLNPTFDGNLGGDPVCPDPNEEAADGTPGSIVSPFWYAGLRFLDTLPLLSERDYSTVDDFDTSSKDVTHSQPDYLRPFAVATVSSKYFRLDRPGQGQITDALLPSGGRTWAASLQMQDGCPGLFIDVHGAAQHVIASGLFSAADSDDDETADIAWTDILCTVCIEFDQHAEAKWPQEDLTTTADVVRELIIDVPHLRLDYLAPNTVLDVDTAGAVITTDGGYVRDDRALMNDIARSAYAWYGQTRKALTIVQHNLICDHEVGELITNIGTALNPTAVNSVITKLDFNILAGTVTIFTQYAELDLVRGTL